MNLDINKMESVEPAAIKVWTAGRTIYIELTDIAHFILLDLRFKA